MFLFKKEITGTPQDVCVYYESIKRELKTRPMYECRCDERLKTQPEKSTRLRDEVNRRDVCECDGWVCVLEVIDDPSMLRLTRKSGVLVRVLPTERLTVEVEESTVMFRKLNSWSCNCQPRSVRGLLVCLLWIDKTRAKDKTYIWVSVWWKTTN